MSDTESTTDALDIDAWIDGAERGEAEVTLTSKGKALTALATLRKKRARALGAPVPGRMVKESAGTTEFDDDIAELEAEVKANEITFRLRGIDGETHQGLLREYPRDKHLLMNAIVAACVVSPEVTVEKVTRIRKGIGEGQFGRLWQTAQSLSFDAEPDLDF